MSPPFMMGKQHVYLTKKVKQKVGLADKRREIKVFVVSKINAIKLSIQIYKLFGFKSRKVRLDLLLSSLLD